MDWNWLRYAMKVISTQSKIEPFSTISRQSSIKCVFIEHILPQQILMKLLLLLAIDFYLDWFCLPKLCIKTNGMFFIFVSHTQIRNWNENLEMYREQLRATLTFRNRNSSHELTTPHVRHVSNLSPWKIFCYKQSSLQRKKIQYEE